MIMNISRIKFIWEKLSKYKNHYNEILNLYDDFFDFSSYLLLTQLPHTYRYNINDKENYQKIIDFCNKYKEVLKLLSIDENDIVNAYMF